MADQQTLRKCDSRTRVFIVSDISNEPDDAESLVRYLLYSNEFDTQGLVACTSTWMRNAVHPEDMEKIVRAYGQVVQNLNAHVHPQIPYPSMESLLALIKTGPAMYGQNALKEGVPLSEGAALLIQRLEESEKPLWTLCWGGTNCLAQALQHIRRHKTPGEAQQLTSRLRIYAISDQDDTGMWIRLNFPHILYIASVHGWNQYGLAAWTGISGDHFYGFDKGGPDSDLVSKEWVAKNIQIGPLGKAYPNFMFIPEGDTPTFLYLIQNGLGCSEHPEWGSWGGRYMKTDLTGGSQHYSDVADTVTGKNGELYTSNHATVWRWREAFQSDFAARMRWTLSSKTGDANHAPVLKINGSDGGPDPVYIEAEAGSQLTLDASESYDPDGDEIAMTWLHYKDVTATQWQVGREVESLDFQEQPSEKPGRVVSLTLPPAEKCAVDLFSGEPLAKGQVMHVVLQGTDSGSPPMTTYKRVVIQITNKQLLGRRAPVEAIADAHGFS